MIMELSSMFPVKRLCEMMGIQRSSFYNWKSHLSKPSEREKTLVAAIMLFKEYHLKYPSHGYRWLNAKIFLDTGQKMSDPYAHKCCKAIGIKSNAKHYRYKKPGNPYRIFPNLLMTEMAITGPLQCIVSDMTAFYVKGSYYELTLYMDLWNNEIVSHSLSARRGDRMTYISGLRDFLELKKNFPDMQTVLHSDQGSVYASKAVFKIFCKCAKRGTQRISRARGLRLRACANAATASAAWPWQVAGEMLKWGTDGRPTKVLIPVTVGTISIAFSRRSVKAGVERTLSLRPRMVNRRSACQDT